MSKLRPLTDVQDRRFRVVHANGQCEHVAPVLALGGCPNGPNDDGPNDGPSDGPSDGHSVHGVGNVQLHS